MQATSNFQLKQTQATDIHNILFFFWVVFTCFSFLEEKRFSRPSTTFALLCCCHSYSAWMVDPVIVVTAKLWTSWRNECAEVWSETSLSKDPKMQTVEHARSAWSRDGYYYYYCQLPYASFLTTVQTICENVCHWKFLGGNKNEEAERQCFDMQTFHKYSLCFKFIYFDSKLFVPNTFALYLLQGEKSLFEHP